MSEAFKPPPFNYCDYRCDRCDKRETCRVYKDDQERLLDHYRKGEDPYDPKIFMNDLKEIFTKTEKMIHKIAQEQGIDLEGASDEEMPEVDPEEYVIYRLAYQYFKEANVLVKELEHIGIPENLQQDFDDFVWYHTLIAAKTGRLVSGFIDDYLDEDITKLEENGTIGVIRKGIDLSKQALENMLSELPDHLYTIADLTDLLRRIEKQLDVDIRQKV
ncbi:hypothetical protein AMJ83_09080 [candidate division WOR_3 bacterium SM23_42]|uniref:Uncharacterized protein n=1 Tax=candidate division WOR_3 bacterium SM23_42 TaxID=1703779 RepID=A0A0S8FQV3_UNCW3|nr:MAG: hypothetical protein AMJ83_09080 [candidate division WOR_3 bacterium SM23_42]